MHCGHRSAAFCIFQKVGESATIWSIADTFTQGDFYDHRDHNHPRSRHCYHRPFT